jgi:hypothetical protein
MTSNAASMRSGMRAVSLRGCRNMPNPCIRGGSQDRTSPVVRASLSCRVSAMNSSSDCPAAACPPPSPAASRSRLACVPRFRTRRFRSCTTSRR